MNTVRVAPKAAYSMAIGVGARAPVPRPLRAPLYRAFSRIVGARIEEAELPLADYPSLGDFFARRLRAGSRSQVPVAGTIQAPADGVIAAAGIASRGHLVQAKGRDYTLAELLDDATLAETLEGGAYATIYLSPRDYHRVHAPVAARILGYRHIPGQLWPVNELFTRSIDKLLCVNERVVIDLEPVDAQGRAVGRCALVMVAAVAVGNISLVHAGGVVRSSGQPAVRFAEPPMLAQGDELGAFLLGSTVVMVFDAKAANLRDLTTGDLVRVGEQLGTLDVTGVPA